MGNYDRKKESRKSITYLATTLGLGGAEGQLYLLCRIMLDAGWRVQVFTLNPGQNEYWEKPIQALGIPLVAIPHMPWPQRILRIARRLRQSPTSIVHGWYFSTNPYASVCGLLAAIPIRFGTIQEHPDYWPYSHFIQWLCLTRLDEIIVNSKTTLDAIRAHHWPISPLRLVQNAVVIPAMENRADLRRMLAKKWSLEASLPWIAAVGRQDQNKNFALLLNAAACLVKRGLYFRLIFIGTGVLRTQLEEQAIELGLEKIVFWAGQIPQVNEMMPAFDLLCLPSRSEGLPNVILEASAAGLPVVATAVGGIPELVIDGKTGWLVPSDDMGALAERLARLIIDSNLRQRMGSAGHERILSFYSVDRFGKAMVNLYETALRLLLAT